MSSVDQGSFSPLQLQAIEIFFSLKQSQAFLLVGGAALIAQGIVDRTTKDLDFFDVSGNPNISVARVASAFAEACIARGLSAEVKRDLGTFVNLSLSSPDDQIEVDIAVDSALIHPPTMTDFAPTPAVEDLAGMKMLALFHRAAPRDFVDVYALVNLLGATTVIDSAAALDSGFNTSVLRDALDTLAAIPNERIPASDELISRMRLFFRQWRDELD